MMRLYEAIIILLQRKSLLEMTMTTLIF